MDVKCERCQSVLNPVRGGYSCPKCHSLYSINLRMIWDGIKKEEAKRHGDS